MDSAFDVCTNQEFPRKIFWNSGRYNNSAEIKKIQEDIYYSLKIQNRYISKDDQQISILISNGVAPLMAIRGEKYAEIYEPVVRNYFLKRFANHESVDANEDMAFHKLVQIDNGDRGRLGERIFMRVLQRASMKKNILQGLYLENEDFLPSDNSFLENCKFDVRVSGLLEEFEQEDFEMFGDEWSKDDENIYALTWKDPNQNWKPLARAIQVKNSAHVDIWTFAWYTQQSNLKDDDDDDDEIPIPCAIQVKNWGEDSRMAESKFSEALESLNPARFYSNTVRTQNLWAEKCNQINFEDGYVRIIVCFVGFMNSVVNSVKEYNSKKENQKYPILLVTPTKEMIGENLWKKYCSNKGMNNSKKIFDIGSLNLDNLKERILEKGKKKRQAEVVEEEGKEEEQEEVAEDMEEFAKKSGSEIKRKKQASNREEGEVNRRGRGRSRRRWRKN